MTDLKYLWENSTSAIFWGFVLAVLLTALVFRLFKDTPTGSRYTEVSTFWGLLMTIMLSVEFISFIGAFQARMAVDDVEEAVKSYGANALNIINIEAANSDAFNLSKKKPTSGQLWVQPCFSNC